MTGTRAKDSVSRFIRYSNVHTHPRQLIIPTELLGSKATRVKLKFWYISPTSVANTLQYASLTLMSRVQFHTVERWAKTRALTGQIFCTFTTRPWRQAVIVVSDNWQEVDGLQVTINNKTTTANWNEISSLITTMLNINRISFRPECEKKTNVELLPAGQTNYQ